MRVQTSLKEVSNPKQMQRIGIIATRRKGGKDFKFIGFFPWTLVVRMGGIVYGET